MKQITGNWNVLRFIRLALGITVMIQAVMTKDPLMELAGAFLTGMAVFNLGCCGKGGCTTFPKSNTVNHKDIEFEEVV